MLVWNRLRVIWGTAYAATAVACSSAKQAILDSSHSIHQSASSSLEDAADIRAVTDSAEVLEKVDSIEGHQNSILTQVIEVQGDLQRVEDVIPWWGTMIGNIAIASTVIAVAFILWHLGVGQLTKRLFWSVGLFIPNSTMRSAQVDRKALGQDNEVSYREAIAVRRSTDPAYDAAYERSRHGR